MSRTLSTKRGSVDSLKVSLRCGWSENARQMRCTVETDKPEALAIGKCLALGRPTAAVFHLMPVMEIGVQRFGADLGVTLACISHTGVNSGGPGRGAGTNRWRKRGL